MYFTGLSVYLWFFYRPLGLLTWMVSAIVASSSVTQIDNRKFILCHIAPPDCQWYTLKLEDLEENFVQ